MRQSGKKERKGKKDRKRTKKAKEMKAGDHMAATAPAKSTIAVDLKSFRSEVSSKNVTKKREHAQGPMGTVWVGECRRQAAAVKMLKKQTFTKSQLTDLIAELTLYHKIRCPNIITTLGACTIPGEVMLITEWMGNGCITKCVGILSTWELMFMAKEAAVGINWLHSNNILHRNIKLSNFMLTLRNSVKVMDIRLCIRDIVLSEKDQCADLIYRAPETFGTDDAWSVASDAYSFGLALIELLSGEKVYKELRGMDRKKITKHIATDKKKTPIPKVIPSNIRGLIKKCIDTNPSKRPSFKKIIRDLEDLSMQSGIAEKTGRRFWAQYFGAKSVVLLAEFLGAMCDFAALEPVKMDPISVSDRGGTRRDAWSCLARLVSEQGSTVSTSGDQIVRMEKFGLALDYFGPFVSVSGNRTFLSRVQEFLSKKNFFGPLQGAETPQFLKKEGDFLIRYSSGEKGMFTISCYQHNGISNHRISYNAEENGYQIEQRKGIYGTMDELLAANAEYFTYEANNSPYDIQNFGNYGDGAVDHGF